MDLLQIEEKTTQGLDEGVALLPGTQKRAKSLASMFFWSTYAAAARPTPNSLGDQSYSDE